MAVLLGSIIIAALVGACSGTQDSQLEQPENIYTIELSSTALTLDVYDKYTVTAAVYDADGNAVVQELSWTSSQSSVVTVDGGELFAAGLGTSTVKVVLADGGAEAELTVTVVHNGYVPTLTLNENQSLVLAEGATFDLSPKVFFKGDEVTYDAQFIYSSADESVATVIDGIIYANKTGETQITVIASWRGLGGESMTGSEDALGLRKTLTLSVIMPD